MIFNTLQTDPNEKEKSAALTPILTYRNLDLVTSVAWIHQSFKMTASLIQNLHLRIDPQIKTIILL